MPEIANQKKPLLRLFQYSNEFKGRISFAIIFSIFGKLFDLAPPFLIGIAVDIVVYKEESLFASWGYADPKSQLIILGVATLIIWIMESLFGYLQQIVWRNLAQVVQHKLRMNTYSHLQELELKYFEDRQTGGLMAILNDDINQLERFLDNGANSIIQVITTVITIGIVFFILSPTTAWMAMLPMPFILLFSFGFQRLLAPKYANVRSKVGILNGQLSNNLSGISTIKSYTTEKFESSRIEHLSNEYQQSNRKAILLSSAFTPLVRMIIVVGFVLMLIFAGIDALNGGLLIGWYSIMIFYTQRLLWPLTRLGETFDQYQRAMASTNRALDLVDTPRQIISGEVSLPIENIRGDIVFDNVGFAYEGRPDVLTKFNVNIKEGQTIAFVGATGSGKSTIIKLLLRFYDIQSGRITLDGNEIKDLNLQDLRRGIGLVSQDTFLIDGTVKENIAYGNPEVNYDEMVTAAKTAEAHSFILDLPQQYETMVGERGQKLSGGQRQRISIARAVLKNPPILVLDEATSDVDNETEAAIQRSLEKIIVDRTTIIIAHRLSTIRNADQIFVLSNGKIIENGTHDKLLEQNGQYASLWKVQTGERILSSN
ncbi:MAG: ABC transporter ATP-binding protein [Candidatus Heimdallarchaeota archaeon]